MEKYIDYVSLIHAASDEVLNWININLKNYLEKNKEDQTEIEHILDFLCSDKAPKRLKKMSYKEALKNTNKWQKTLIKQAKDIEEKEEDTEIVLDFKDGFNFVKLIGKNAYDREGKLMSHCVSSYYGKDDEVFSLRDKENNPHCTISSNSQQIKGKGNGSINPKYIKYVV